MSLIRWHLRELHDQIDHDAQGPPEREHQTPTAVFGLQPSGIRGRIFRPVGEAWPWRGGKEKRRPPGPIAPLPRQCRRPPSGPIVLACWRQPRRGAKGILGGDSPEGLHIERPPWAETKMVVGP